MELNTAFNAFPDRRDLEQEEPTPERFALNQIDARIDRLWDEKRKGGPDVDETVQSSFNILSSKYGNFLRAFVDWKRFAPERAMRELLATAKVLGREVALDQEPEIDLQAWTAAMVLTDTGPDEAYYRSLFRSATDGLQSRLG